MSDIQLSASIDDSGVAQATRRMDGDVKAFTRSATNEYKRLEKAANKANGARTPGFAGAGGSRLGAVSLQAQDVAVQLQGGASAATVIAQQGSQIASIFGPGGAILGGVIAIGAAMFTWGKASEQAIEKQDEFNKRLEESARLMATVEGKVGGDIRGAAEARAERTQGKDAAAALRLEHERQSRIDEIEDTYKRSNMQVSERDYLLKRVNERYDEESKLLKHNQALAKKADDEQAKAQEKATQKERQSTLYRIRENQLQMDGETNLAKAARLNAEADAMTIPDARTDAAGALEASLEQSNKRTDATKLQNAELEKQAAAARDIGAMLKKAADEAISLNTEYRNGQVAIQNQQIEADKAFGQDIVDRARLGPGGVRAQEKARKADDRAIQKQIARDIEKEDRRRRQGGERALTEKEREDMRIQKTELAQGARDGKFIKIDPADMTAFADKVAAAVLANITK